MFKLCSMANHSLHHTIKDELTGITEEKKKGSMMMIQVKNRVPTPIQVLIWERQTITSG